MHSDNLLENLAHFYQAEYVNFTVDLYIYRWHITTMKETMMKDCLKNLPRCMNEKQMQIKKWQWLYLAQDWEYVI